jgi:hypothetical protein
MAGKTLFINASEALMNALYERQGYQEIILNMQYGESSYFKASK